MSHGQQRRNVLVVEDEASLRKVCDALRAGLGCDGNGSHNGHLALEMIERESFGVLLLDLRRSEMPTREMKSAIQEVRPKLVGRVLVISGEVSDPQLMKMIKRNCWSYFSWRQVMQDLWEQVRSLLGFSQLSTGKLAKKAGKNAANSAGQ